MKKKSPALLMRLCLVSLTSALLLSLSATLYAQGASAPLQALFNGHDLDGWDTWLGAKEVPAMPFKLWGEWAEVVGLNSDPDEVFSVVSEDDAPAIRISGTTWGALISKSEFSNYHLSLEYKWGLAKHAPRDEKPRNTGVLYHSAGPHGAFWSYWMRSGEFEIMEGRTGDFTSVDGVLGSVETAWDRPSGIPWQKYQAGESAVDVGGMVFRVRASTDNENPSGQWNTLELYVLGSEAVHVVNGEKVLHVKQLAHKVDGDIKPLTRGKLQLQSEGAEVFFRNIQIMDIDSIELGTEES